MKKIILIMIAIVIAFGAVNAQNVNLNYVKVDSVTNITPTSAIAWCHYNALIAVGFRQFCYGTGGNFNSNCSVATLINPVADTTIAITLTGLTPSTTYSYKAKVLPGAASGSSAVGTFTTPSCFPTPVISSSTSASICPGILDTLTASTLGATYQWKKNNVIIAGATASTFVANTSGSYTVDVTIIGCTESAAPFTLTVSPPWIFAAGLTTICVGDSAVINGSIASSYLWSTGETTNAIKVGPTTTTSYTVTGTNSYGCSLTSVSTVTVNSLPIGTLTQSNLVCAGGSSPLIATGGTSYLWSPGSTLSSTTGSTVTASPISGASTYTVIATDVNGCKDTNTINIAVYPLPTVLVTASANTICVGTTTTLNVTGANTYLWGGGETLTSINVTPVSTVAYNVTGTDVFGCAKNTNFTIVVNPLPSVTAVASPNTICSGSTSTLTAGGASTYTWSTGQTGSSFNTSPPSTTTYIVTGTDANACINTSSVTITVNPLPIVTVTASALIVCNGTSTTLTAGGASTYIWNSGQTGFSYFVVPNTTTTYSVVGTNANNCTNNASVTVTVNPTPLITVTASANTICNGTATTLTAGGASTYSWGGGQTTASFSITPINTTSYGVVGTDINGCVSGNNILITVNPLPSVTAVASPSTICAGATSTLTAGGASTYTWSTGQTGSSFNTSPPSTTTYIVTGTDANACINTSSVTITVNPLPVATVTPNDSICLGSTKSLVASGGTSCFWYPSAGLSSTSGFSVNANPIITTIYSAVLTDPNGCKDTAITKVKVNALPIVTAVASVGTICAGTSTTLTGSGANVYSWTGGQIGSPVNINPANTISYSAVGTDINGCVSNSNVVVITVHPSPIGTVSANSSVCIGGSKTFTSSGGISCSWFPVTGLSSATGFSVNANPTVTTIYSAVVSDINGCKDTVITILSVNPLPVVSAVAGSPFCKGGSTTLTGAGGSSYSWSPSTSLSSTTLGSVIANPIITKTYTVTATDINGCVDTASVIVTVNPLPVITTSGNATVCSGTSATLSASGANTYSWSGGQTGSSIVVTPTGSVSLTETVTGTDINGCINTASVIVTPVTNNTSVSITSNLGIVEICKEATNHIITFTGSPSPGTFSANGISFAGNNFNAATANAGTNTLTYTYLDGNGCPKSASMSVRVDSVPVVNNVTVTGSGTTKTVGVQGIFGSSLKLKTSGSTTHVYTPSMQNTTSAVFNNVEVSDVDAMYFQYSTDGCFFEKSFVGVNETIKDEDVKLFPNPFMDVLHVELPYGKYEINVVNNLGQIVRSIKEEGNSFQILKNDLPQGLYLVKIISSNSILTKKVFIE